MPDRIQTRSIDPLGELRGLAGSVWNAMDEPAKRQARADMKSGMTAELVTEANVNALSIKDQQLFVNADENDSNPLSKIHRP